MTALYDYLLYLHTCAPVYQSILLEYPPRLRYALCSFGVVGVNHILVLGHEGVIRQTCPPKKEEEISE